MKKDIHPKYVETVIRCACGNEVLTRSTVENINVEICANCHPFFTGKQKLVDTAGRVERFRRRYGLGEDESTSKAIDVAAKRRLQKAEREKARPEAQEKEAAPATEAEIPGTPPEPEPAETVEIVVTATPVERPPAPRKARLRKKEAKPEGEDRRKAKKRTAPRESKPDEKTEARPEGERAVKTKDEVRPDEREKKTGPEAKNLDKEDVGAKTRTKPGKPRKKAAPAKKLKSKKEKETAAKPKTESEKAGSRTKR